MGVILEEYIQKNYSSISVDRSPWFENLSPLYFFIKWWLLLSRLDLINSPLKLKCISILGLLHLNVVSSGKIVAFESEKLFCVMNKQLKVLFRTNGLHGELITFEMGYN